MYKYIYIFLKFIHSANIYGVAAWGCHAHFWAVSVDPFMWGAEGETLFAITCCCSALFFRHNVYEHLCFYYSLQPFRKI